MLIRTKADWSALFSSHKYVHYKAHYYLLWSIPGHHNLSATRQKLFYTPMLPYIKDECHYNSTTLFIITDTILVLSWKVLSDLDVSSLKIITPSSTMSTNVAASYYPFSLKWYRVTWSSPMLVFLGYIISGSDLYASIQVAVKGSSIVVHWLVAYNSTTSVLDIYTILWGHPLF